MITFKPWYPAESVEMSLRREWADAMVAQIRSEGSPATVRYCMSGDTMAVAVSDGNGTIRVYDTAVRGEVIIHGTTK